ncbi:SRPBCC domain-containing protein [Streptomyces sp. t39]|uniref:SRPBCC domain-containing protein n=1 Tax=Streptomyces sp. t39 TaxID=1828156 RepID=UPI0011CDB28D|nr:SRPBCC domain-containing protein [Streptomyces sp. t39]TXS56105.1 carbon monoxide dehydrogenase [Streptomyces sp. t39]
MEHEAFVPVPAETLRQALRDPARVARCVPGLQQDADEAAGPLAGRLKVRVGSHTITYRGVLRVVEQGRDFVVDAEGAEVRGSGSVKVGLTVRPEPTDGGTTLTFTGSAGADGRLAELTEEARTSAAHRLLDRFAEALAAVAFEEPRTPAESGGAAEAAPSGSTAVSPSPPTEPGDTPDGQEQADHVDDIAAQAGDDGPGAAGDADITESQGLGSVFDVPVPPPSLGPDAEDAFGDESDRPAADADEEDLSAIEDLQELDELAGLPGEPAAEAAHARRTMIGRSAEEVDHAPPRGRYAPAPAPSAGGTGAALRWIAPAAALAIASAVVVGRALRRRN